MAAAKSPHPPAAQAAQARTRKKGGDFGAEGTNKTQPAPKPDTAAPEDLGIKPHIEKSPYQRG